MPRNIPRNIVDQQTLLSRGAAFQIAVMLFVLSAVIRLTGLSSATLQVDEIHWKNRGELLLHEIEHHHYRSATSFLQHPGVTPAILIAGTQRLARSWNGRMGVTPTSGSYIDPYTASRLACAFAVCLFIPVLFYCFRSFVGEKLSLFAALGFALEPLIIGYSRLAHLDAVMAGFVGVAACLYFRAINERSLLLKLLAGVFWGFALLTKATAIALPVGFLAYRVLREFSPSARRAGEQGVFHWTDLWAIFVGHLVFIALYTRMWSHTSEFRWKGELSLEVADRLYDFGCALHVHWPLLLAAFVIGLFLTVPRAVMLYKASRDRTIEGWGLGIAASVFGVLVLLTAWPPLVQNLWLFWKAVAELQDLAHESIGYVAKPVPGRYFTIIFTRLSSLMVVLSAVGLIGLGFRYRLLIDQRSRFIWFAVTIVVVWIALLTSSPKEAFRYIIPVMPLFFLVPGIGIETISRVFRRNDAKDVSSKSWASLVFPFVCVVYSANCAYQFCALFPDTLLFFNQLSGGISGAMSRHSAMPLAGSDAGLRFLRENFQPSTTQPLIVSAISDIDALEHADRRMNPQSAEALRFRNLTPNLFDEIVWIFHPMQAQFGEENVIRFTVEESLFEYQLEGEKLFTIARIAPREISGVEELHIHRWNRTTGSVVERGKIPNIGDLVSPKVIVADPKRHDRGFLFFGDGLRLPAGRYRFSLSGALLKGTEESSEIPANFPILDFKFGANCSRMFLTDEFELDRLHSIQFECEFPSPYKQQLRGFWNGKVSLLLARLTVERLRP